MKKLLLALIIITLVCTFSLTSTAFATETDGLQTIIDAITTDFVKGLNDTTKTFFNEWEIIEVIANKNVGLNPDNFIQFMRTKINGSYKNDVKGLEKATIALTMLGYDALNFDMGDAKTVDLISMIANNAQSNGEFTLVDAYGLAFALIAYDAGNYEVLAENNHYTREQILTEITLLQKENGSFNDDVDQTSMIIASLVPYQTSDPKIKTMIEKSVAWLSTAQLVSGGFSSGGSWGSENSNSLSVTIVALNSLGINCDTDARFIKGENSAYEALMNYKITDKTTGKVGFKFMSTSSSANAMASEQAVRALIGFKNLKLNSAPFNIYAVQTQYELSVVSNVGGEIVLPQKAIYGSDITLKINVKEGYQLMSVKIDGIKVEMTSTEYVIKNVTKNILVNVEFEKEAEKPTTPTITAPKEEKSYVWAWVLGGSVVGILAIVAVGLVIRKCVKK